jgi:hypothetical protein
VVGFNEIDQRCYVSGRCHQIWVTLENTSLNEQASGRGNNRNDQKQMALVGPMDEVVSVSVLGVGCVAKACQMVNFSKYSDDEFRL